MNVPLPSGSAEGGVRLIERGADDVDAEPLQLGQVAAIGEFLQDHRVARFQQHLVDQIDCLP